MTLDLSLVPSYLKAVRIPFNPGDKIVCNGDLGRLEGTIEQYGGMGQLVYFTILGRANGIFVDWHYRCGESRIEKVAA